MGFGPRLVVTDDAAGLCYDAYIPEEAKPGDVVRIDMENGEWRPYDLAENTAFDLDDGPSKQLAAGDAVAKLPVPARSREPRRRAALHDYERAAAFHKAPPEDPDPLVAAVEAPVAVDDEARVYGQLDMLVAGAFFDDPAAESADFGDARAALRAEWLPPAVPMALVAAEA